MKKMINPKRVRRIKNFIYTLLILLLLVPVVLLIVVSLNLYKTLDDLNASMSDFTAYMEQAQVSPAVVGSPPPETSEPDNAPPPDSSAAQDGVRTASEVTDSEPKDVSFEDEAASQQDDEPQSLPLASAGEADAGTITPGGADEPEPDATSSNKQVETAVTGDATAPADPGPTQDPDPAEPANDSTVTTLPLTGSRAAA